VGSLIDSSIFIAAERGVLAPDDARRLITPGTGFAMASVTAAELLHGVYRADNPERRKRREEIVEAFLAAVPIIDFDLAAARVRARVDADLQARGVTVPRDDLAIACTALSRGFDLVTRNLRDFKKVPGLVVVIW
jgi:tRNA(fMet)-specific endonuclease VapC